MVKDFLSRRGVVRNVIGAMAAASTPAFARLPDATTRTREAVESVKDSVVNYLVARQELYYGWEKACSKDRTKHPAAIPAVAVRVRSLMETVSEFAGRYPEKTDIDAELAGTDARRRELFVSRMRATTTAMRTVIALRHDHPNSVCPLTGK